MIKEFIESNVDLGRPNSKGWQPTLCKVCNDHGRKGKRAAFRFDGTVCAYKCQNCGIKGAYDTQSHSSPSDTFVEILTAFGLPQDVVSELGLRALQNRLSGVTPTAIKAAATANVAKEIELPECFVKLQDVDPSDPVRQLAEVHLMEDRLIDPDAYTFYIGTKTTVPEYKKWANRLIIPIYNRQGRLIFFQGRDLTGLAARKYLSVNVPREAVMYGMAELDVHTNRPLFVTEGFFDAFHLKGVAVLGRDLTQPVIDMLNKSPREKIVVPDKFGDGGDLAMAAIKQGWKVSTPEFGNCKDVTDAVLKYGKLYVVKTITDNVYSGIAAETMVKLYCGAESKK